MVTLVNIDQYLTISAYFENSKTVVISEAEEHYSLSYSYFDEMAQTYCASRSAGWVFAIRRNCAHAPTCNDMCANASVSILRFISNRRSRYELNVFYYNYHLLIFVISTVFYHFIIICNFTSLLGVI